MRPGGPVVVAGELGVGEALVVSEVEIGFGAVVGDEDLAVLKRRHGARVDVQVRIELHQVDFEAAALEQTADRGCRQTLAQMKTQLRPSQRCTLPTSIPHSKLSWKIVQDGVHDRLWQKCLGMGMWKSSLNFQPRAFSFFDSLE